jgi:hypothetical protein
MSSTTSAGKWAPNLIVCAISRYSLNFPRVCQQSYMLSNDKSKASLSTSREALLGSFPAFYGTRRFITAFIKALHPYIQVRGSLCRFVTSLFFCGEGLLAPPQTPKLEDHPLSLVRGCLFNIFAANLHYWRPSLPSTTRGRAMPW